MRMNSEQRALVRELLLATVVLFLAAFAATLFASVLSAVLFQLLLGLSAWVLIQEHRMTESLKLTCCTLRKQVMFGAVLALCVAAVVFVTFAIFRSVALFPAKGASIGILIYTVLFQALVGICEELFFRGYLAGLSHRLFQSIWPAALLSALVFGLLHFMSNRNWIQLCFTTAYGLFTAVLYLKHKSCSILTIISMHICYNYLVNFLFTT